jgi:predicted MFS family arabinose efflux permease
MKPIWPILSGICATMTGIGLSRFAYAPLLPAIVQSGQLSGGQAGVLGAINLGGYLVGAFTAANFGRALGLRRTLRASMIVVTLCFLLCALPGGLLWLTPWRALTGLAAGVLMVLAGPAVQNVVPARMRGLASGLVFAGVGSGIVIGAILVPLVLPQGVPAVWLALAALAAGLTVFSWRLWPNVPAPPAVRMPKLRGPAGWLVLSYAFAAIAQTVHMVWWPDFIARGLGRSTEAASLFWLLYGIAAASGPALYGQLADRIGARRTLSIIMAAQVAALGLPLLSTSTAALTVSAIAAGSAALGSTAVTIIRSRELGGGDATGLWRMSTSAFGLTQTASGFAMAWLYTQGGHPALFALGLAAALGALLTARS